MTFNEDEILEYRREKDAAFRTEKSSPIPYSERSQFTGLKYFPPDRAYYVPTKLVPPPTPGSITIPTSDGDERVYTVAGTFSFQVPSGKGTLAAFREDEDDPDLFIPFRDATAPKETYGAGRYLDLPHRPNSLLFLDFNLAYNPYCAYNDDFSCPFPPKENWLPIALPVGEKKYRDD